MLETLIHYDQQLLLWLNGFHCEWADTFMWYVTKTWTWIPLHAVMLTLLWRRLGGNWRLMLLAVVGVALVVLCADQFASGLCKDFFCRPRPSREPLIEHLVHVVNGHRGGHYGFISSHAANTFGVATYLSVLLDRRRSVVITMFAWASLCTYSRIYLGVHYPGDVLCGAVAGVLIALFLCLVYRKLERMIINNQNQKHLCQHI